MRLLRPRYLASSARSVIKVEVQPGMREVVKERHREVYLILSMLHLDKRLERTRAPLRTDTFRRPMLPLVGRNDPDVDAQLVSPVTQRRHEVSGLAGCFRVEIGQWLTLGLRDRKSVV